MDNILVYPHKITNGAKLWHVCKELNIKIINNPKDDFDYAIYWNNQTISSPDKIIKNIAQKMRVINIGCFNVLKSNVDKIWQQVSGYNIKINPAKFNYKYVRKSQLQYRSHTGEKHDGIIFDFKQKRDPKYVYQRLIDTSLGSKKFRRYRTLRLPIFNDNIPCLIIKESIDRFKEVKTRISICDPLDYFSFNELLLIRKFRKKFGVDYGELDILRDKNTNRIYVIDVNNLAGDGMFGKLPFEEITKLKILFAQTFKKEFL